MSVRPLPPAVIVDHVEDHEGHGECQRCGRAGLRWIVVLSDGSRAGLECTTTILGGGAITSTSIGWVAQFDLIARHEENGEIWTLYQRKNSGQTADARNGRLHTMGGARQQWHARGWIDQVPISKAGAPS